MGPAFANLLTVESNVSLLSVLIGAVGMVPAILLGESASAKGISTGLTALRHLAPITATKEELAMKLPESVFVMHLALEFTARFRPVPTAAAETAHV